MNQTAPQARWHFTQKQGIFIILIFAAVLRLPELFGEWQYDEIWSLLNFTGLSIGQILTDISLPNNHPVNTLLMKLLKNISQVPEVIRLGVFFTGISVVFLVMRLASRAGEKENTVAMYSAGILAAVSPALILFSVTARGYIFQLAGLLVCADGLLDAGTGKKSKYTGVKIIGGGILAFLSVSSGIMFLGVAALGYLLLAPKERRWDKQVLISGVVLLIAALAYYVPLYDKLRAGQQWGNEISSFTGLISFVFSTLKAHLPAFTALLTLCGVIFQMRMRKIFLLALLPPVLALFTKAGPERVYLPLTVLFTVMGGCGAAELWNKVSGHRKLLNVIFCCGVALNFNIFPEAWKLPAPAAEMKRTIAENDSSVLPVIASAAGFPVLANEPETAQEIDRRGAFPGTLLMLGCPNGVFNGADVNNSEQNMEFPVSGSFHAGAVPGYMYKLALTENVSVQDTVLAVFSAPVPAEFIALPGKKLRLNLWINQRNVLYICKFSTSEIPYFEGVKYFLLGEKND